jgi:hypothetical protein
MSIMITTLRWMTLLAVLGACGGGGDDGGEASDRSQQCARVRDHLVDLRLAESHGLRKEDLDQHRLALSRAFDSSFLDSCMKSSSEASLDCVLGAADAQAAAACLTGTSGNPITPSADGEGSK